MKKLPELIEKRHMKFSLLQRTEQAAIYEQRYDNGVKVGFEVFKIRESKGYTFPNGVYVEPGESYPADNDFGVSAWSFVIINDEDFSYLSALLKFKELNNTPMKKIDTQNQQVIEDAVKLLKSEFIDLYGRLGFDKTHLGVSWHSIVTSPRGVAYRNKFKGAKHLQSLSFISNMEEEVKARSNKDLEQKEESTPAEATESSSNSNLKPNNMSKEKGEKASRAQQFIDQGITDPKELAEKAGISKVYAGRLLEKVGTVKKEEIKQPSILEKIKAKKKEKEEVVETTVTAEEETE